jgi:spore maturation protein SpmB
MPPEIISPGWQVISESVSSWVIPFIVLGVVLFSYARKVRVYEVFIEGAKEGFQVAVMIIPYLVAIFMAIALFRSSGALAYVGNLAGYVLPTSIMPTEVLMMALLKPMSGSGARGLMIDAFNQYGVDSYAGFLASAIQGSTETTFYVIAVYLGAVGIKNGRYVVTVGLIAELVAVTAAVILSCLWWRYKQ